MDGLQVLEVMRADPSMDRIPVIMVTSKNEPSDIVAGMKAGADDFIGKPFAKDEGNCQPVSKVPFPLPKIAK